MPRLAITELGTVLGVWAHPDDEAYLSAGVMALAREAGQRVVCATATRGERGTNDPVRWPPWRLARVREAEVRASLAALGVTEHHFLDLVDGTLEHEDAGPAVDRIAGLMAEVRPDTILTFGPDGLTGHADHRRVSSWTTAARELAAPSARLLYATATVAHTSRWSDLHERFNVYLEPDLPVCARPDDVVIDVAFDPALADRKLVALRAQASQTADLVDALGDDTYRAWIAAETFRAAPRLVPETTGTPPATAAETPARRPAPAATGAPTPALTR